jgi:hypothetical protein
MILVQLADPKRPIQDVTKDLVGTSISVKVIKFSLIVPLHYLFEVVSSKSYVFCTVSWLLAHFKAYYVQCVTSEHGFCLISYTVVQVQVG